MRLAISLALVLAAAGAHRGCGSSGAYDPCAGKACGAQCHLCAPGDPTCVETADVKACDPSGRCGPLVDGLCGAPIAACAGKACGDACTIDPPCRSATPPCMVPSLAGRCDPAGACDPTEPPRPDLCAPVASCAGVACGVRCTLPCSGTPCTPALGWCDGGGACSSAAPPCPASPPSWGCTGKACGDPCGFCPPGADPATCPVPTLAPTACDGALQCVTADTFTCSPQAACLGKTCGDACETCPACLRPSAMSCDASLTCVQGTVACGP